MKNRRILWTAPIAALLAVGPTAPAQAAVINGTAGPDVLVGTARADTIHGFGGADKLYGKAGGDRLYGGKDLKRDLLYGGPGGDLIAAGWRDRVYAGWGNDRVLVPTKAPNMQVRIEIWCGPGHDHVVGGSRAAWSWGLIRAHGCEDIDPAR